MSGRIGRAIPWLLVLVATALLIEPALAHQSAHPLLGRENSDPFTDSAAALVHLLGLLAAAGTVGALGRVVLTGRRRRGTTALDETALDQLATARHWAIGWACAALLRVPLDAAATSAVPVSVVAGSLSDFLASVQTTQAWLLTAIVAFAVSLLLPAVRRWRAAAVLLAVSVLVQLATVVTAQVSVGANHDLATDVAVFGTVALWTAIAVALGLGGADRPDLRNRRRRLLRIALPVALAARVLVGLFEMAGQTWWQPYGWTVIAALVLLVAALVLRGRFRVAALLGVLGSQVLQLVLAPPRYSMPQTPQINYLGYEIEDAPRLLSLLLPGRINLLVTVIALTAIVLYLLGVRRLRRRGDRWPTGRIVSWLLGWAIVLYIVVSQVWQYSASMFTWHMVVHMVLNMFAPALLVLAGPLTLLLRCRPAAAPGRLWSIRDFVAQGLTSRLLRVVGHPLVIWFIFVATFYALYLTGLFDVAMKYHWAHQLMTLHFIIGGALYYQVVIGVDSPGRPIPHVAKLGYILAAMPFHAFFAVAVLNSAVIGEQYYLSLGLPWQGDLAEQQQVGGQLAWGMGELPLLGVTIALLAQWFRSDAREARRFDRAQDSGLDTSLDAYNEMLAELERRERAGR